MDQVLDYLGISRKRAVKMIQDPDILEGLAVAAVGAVTIGTGAVSLTTGIGQVLWGATMVAGGAVIRQGNVVIEQGKPLLSSVLQDLYDVTHPPQLYLYRDVDDNDWDDLGAFVDTRKWPGVGLTAHHPIPPAKLSQFEPKFVVGTAESDSDDDAPPLISLSSMLEDRY